MKHHKSLRAIQKIVAHHDQRRKNKYISPAVLGMLHLTYVLFLKRLVQQARSMALAKGNRCITAEDFYEVAEDVLKASAG